MTKSDYTDEELRAYIDELLPPARMIELERLLRQDAAARNRYARLIRERDQGAHSVGDIWRRFRLSCPDRNQLGSYLLGTMPVEEADYVRFHLESIGCRICQANLDDLEQAAQEDAQQIKQRRQKYFNSSAGYLRRDDDSGPG